MTNQQMAERAARIERELEENLWRDQPITATDCETCVLQKDCERINGLNEDMSNNVNGCLI